MIKKRTTYVIAEAGVNHNGSIALAIKLIDAAAHAGADAVKFQTFKAKELVSASAPKAKYQMASTSTSESQLDMLKKLELDETAHDILSKYCKMRRIQFLSTPFDEESINMLAQRIKVPVLKLPSGEITNGPLLLKAARTKKPVILSTGMSTLTEIREALGVLAFGYITQNEKPSLTACRAAFKSNAGYRALQANVALLHCTTDYPAAFKDVNLCAMDTMRVAFGLPVGLSDHTQGIAVSIAAVALGATIIEKHFTLDRTLPGPDHKASLMPEELCQLVQSIQEIEAALGSSRKGPSGSEVKNIKMARRSLVAIEDISIRELFTTRNLGCKRPGTGISPMQYWSFIGRKASKKYFKDELIK